MHGLWGFFLPHLGLRVHLTLVRGSTARVFMHARIDTLTRPRFWSLLPSTILDWVVIIVSISLSVDVLKHTDTSRECYLEYFTCPVRTGSTSFWLVPVSTVPAVLVYIFGSVSLPGQHIILLHGTHHNFGIPGWAQSIENGPIRGKYSTLAETQVCKCVVRQEEKRYMLSYQES